MKPKSGSSPPYGGSLFNKMKKFKTIEAVALLVGTVVGAGFLGIPYVVSKVGFHIGLALIVFLGLLMLVQYLLIVETTLRTNDQHQLAGYVEKYLGEKWRGVIYTLVILEAYGALLAYLVAEGQVLSALFGGSAFMFSLAYFAVVAAIAFVGLRLVEKVDLLLTLIMAVVVIVIGFMSWSAVKFDNFYGNNFGEFLPAYGIILFSFLGASAVPQMRRVLRGQERSLPRAVLWGALVPIVIYILFTTVVLGVTGDQTSQVATVALGKAVSPSLLIVGNLLAVVTMTTSFLGISMALKQTFSWDMKKTRTEAWLLTVLVPLILFLFGLHNFIGILMVVGAFLGGAQGIILVATSLRAETRGDRKPEFVLPAKKFFGAILILVFAFGIVYTIISVGR